MELVSGLLSRVWLLAGLSDATDDKRSKKMEEKALEVYGSNYGERLIKLFFPLPAGLCLQVKLQRCLPFKHKVLNKQINDKERVAAAMENPSLREMVEQCVTEPDD
uniref:Uncharacterized protein n=1 Tax=Cyprinus carpio TaxID=7962 RepID=A0A8C2JLA6_CYPCA